jgi:hypothetical protein
MVETRQMADGRWQMAEERKDFRQKGGDRGGFGMIYSLSIEVSNATSGLRQKLSVSSYFSVPWSVLEWLVFFHHRA